MKKGLLKKGILCSLSVLLFFSFTACSSKEKDKTSANSTSVNSKQASSNELTDGEKKELKALIEASIKLQYDKTTKINPQELYTDSFLSTIGPSFHKDKNNPYKLVDITFKAKDKNLKADAAAIVKLEDKSEKYEQELRFVKLNGTYYIDKILLDK